jgi:hypothetical protein
MWRPETVRSVAALAVYAAFVVGMVVGAMIGNGVAHDSLHPRRPCGAGAFQVLIR